MSAQQVVIYAAKSLPQAHLLRNMLEDLGIRAEVINDALQMGIGDLPMGWSTLPRVVVGAEHAEQARTIALAFDAETRAARSGESETEKETEAEQPVPQRAAVWPQCPECHQPREAVCPACGTSGSDFPPADSFYTQAEGVSESEAVGKAGVAETATPPTKKAGLICTVCEEPFAANYYRTCGHCGHDFGEGRERVAERSYPPVVGLAVLGLIGVAALVSWGGAKGLGPAGFLLAVIAVMAVASYAGRRAERESTLRASSRAESEAGSKDS